MMCKCVGGWEVAISHGSTVIQHKCNINHKGDSGIEKVVRPAIVAHRGRRCPEALCVSAEA